MTCFTRRELLDLIWSKPMRTAAAEVGVSDVALRKVVVRAGLPIPPQGHWNRVAAGKPSAGKPDLPPRGFGASDGVSIGPNTRFYVAAENPEDGPPPSPPAFEESIEDVRRRAVAAIGRVSVPRDFERPHPAIRTILDEEEARAAKAKSSPYVASYYAPRFGSPADRRRLRIANSIALALARIGLSVTSVGKEDMSLQVLGGASRLTFAVLQRRAKSGRGEARDDVLRFVLGPGLGDGKREIAYWDNEPDRRLESIAAEIAVETAVALERRYREGCEESHRQSLAHREWRIREAKEAAEEARRRERERREALERARVERLLADAERLRKTDAIRDYVAEVGRRAAEGSPEEFARWSAWALAQADRIDPTRDLGFLASEVDPG